MMVAAAALMLAAAFAVICLSDDGFCSPDPQNGPFEQQGPAPDGPRMPTGPQQRTGVPPQEPQRYVIDAPGHPDARPDRIIDDYGRMYEEKRILEEQGAEVYVFDPELERDAGRELAGIINTVFDGTVVSERPKGAETVSPEQLPDTYSVSFLEIMLEQTGEDSWIRELLSVMISQYVSSGGSEGIAPSPGREDRGIEIPSDIITEEDEKDPVSFVDDLPEFTPSSESYLTQHGFDGGTSF